MGKWAKALAGVTHGVREPWGQEGLSTAFTQACQMTLTGPPPR